MANELLQVWSDSPATSLVIWAVIAIIILYLGRKQAHQLFWTSGYSIYSTLRVWAFGVSKLEKRLTQRNHEVLLANGEKAAEKAIEREFTRINNIVKRDLSGYPSLHRQISESIENIESDYQKSTQVAPLPPAWGNVVETIASLPSSGDPTVVKILTNIKKAVDESHAQTLKAFKKSAAESHRLLSAMQPHWRNIDSKLNQVDEKINGLDQCSKNIDQQIADYAEILHKKDSALSALGSSALTQFFISGLVLIIAVLGGLINFQLIAMPMSEMVGGSSYIGSMKTSDIAALVIILIEIAMGLFLFESLRITGLFPIIGTMEDRMRRRMMVVTFILLTILATIEASLAYMRDLLALDREALQQSLVNVGAAGGIVEAQFRWIPSIGQMIMGFILPFALAFIAIPLESFIHSLRVVLGLVAIGLLRTLRLVLRMVGGFFKHLSKMMIYLFDIFIMLPLSIEQLVKSRQSDKSKSEQQKENVSVQKLG
ncbi:hypothetical protein [Aliikangiella sp. G2MR2-5]|uniref:hypothetical protein n=1 Tax=Aliikangiella sp. G2MR2-5 TaxID=2788943 RepID=UPI0018A9768F|nr:hypothetical protein [Aliikangiella sp. G2MR2-5]